MESPSRGAVGDVEEAGRTSAVGAVGAEATGPGHAEIAARLHAAAIRLLRRLRSQDAASGLSGPRLSALSVLVFGGPRSLGELADAEQVTAPSMSRLATALEEAGLARRGPDPDDGRRVLLRATAAGERLLQEGRQRRIGETERLLGSIEETDWDILRQATGILEGVLREEGSRRRETGTGSPGG